MLPGNIVDLNPEFEIFKAQITRILMKRRSDTNGAVTLTIKVSGIGKPTDCGAQMPSPRLPPLALTAECQLNY
jgi:hypothetical protein